MHRNNVTVFFFGCAMNPIASPRRLTFLPAEHKRLHRLRPEAAQVSIFGPRSATQSTPILIRPPATYVGGVTPTHLRWEQVNMCHWNERFFFPCAYPLACWNNFDHCWVEDCLVPRSSSILSLNYSFTWFTPVSIRAIECTVCTSVVAAPWSSGTQFRWTNRGTYTSARQLWARLVPQYTCKRTL